MNDQVSAVVRDAAQVVEYVGRRLQVEGGDEGARGGVDLVQLGRAALVGDDP